MKITNFAVRGFACIFVVASLAACSTMQQRSLHETNYQYFPYENALATIGQVRVIDELPSSEHGALSRDTRFVVVLLLYNQWASEGHVRSDADYYSPDVRGETTTLLVDALERSKLMATGHEPGKRMLDLEVTLTHLYGITHSSRWGVVTIAGADVVRSFGPYGFAAARVRLLDQGNEVGNWVVTGAFDPSFDHMLKKNQNPLMNTIENQLPEAAVYAMGDLITNIQRVIEPQIATTTCQEAVDADDTFLISRVDTDGQATEVAQIDFETGKIMAVYYRNHWMPPYGAHDEWVVDPYQACGNRLSTPDYDKLVSRIAQKYDVRYVNNVRIAHFFQPGAPEPAL